VVSVFEVFENSSGLYLYEFYVSENAEVEAEDVQNDRAEPGASSFEI
jgi:hypothetical protein